MSSRSLATRLAPLSATAESSRCSLVVAIADSMLAAITMALSSLRSWCPKSASRSSPPAGSSPLRRERPSVQLISRRLSRRHEYLLGELDPVAPEVLQVRRPCAGRGVIADGAPISGNADLPEREQLLERDLAVFQSHHLGDAD